jgi:hypothetical protein
MMEVSWQLHVSTLHVGHLQVVHVRVEKLGTNTQTSYTMNVEISNALDNV